jgi:hypothetical protein
MGWHSVTNLGDTFRVNLMLDFCPAANIAARNAPSPPYVEGAATPAPG